MAAAARDVLEKLRAGDAVLQRRSRRGARGTERGNIVADADILGGNLADAFVCCCGVDLYIDAVRERWASQVQAG